MLIPKETRHQRNARRRPAPAVSAMARAARHGQIETIRFLLRNGADVDARGHLGQTALHAAATRGQAEAVRFLLDEGADVNALDGLGATPLDWARTFCHTRTIGALRFAGGRRARGEAPRRYLAYQAS